MKIALLSLALLSCSAMAHEALIGVDSNFNNDFGVQLHITDLSGNAGGFIGYDGNTDSTDKIKGFNVGVNYHFNRFIPYVGYTYSTEKKETYSRTSYMPPYQMSTTQHTNKTHDSGVVFGAVYKCDNAIYIGAKYDTALSTGMITFGYKL